MLLFSFLFPPEYLFLCLLAMCLLQTAGLRCLVASLMGRVWCSHGGQKGRGPGPDPHPAWVGPSLKAEAPLLPSLFFLRGPRHCSSTLSPDHPPLADGMEPEGRAEVTWVEVTKLVFLWRMQDAVTLDC
jgi:hypothetical protein